jgi:hypothetical protein
MKKQLNTDAVMNELRTGSAFFKQSEPEDPSTINAPSQNEQMPQPPPPEKNEPKLSTAPQKADSKQESMLASKQVSIQEKEQESLQANSEESIEDKILAAIAITPIKPNTFRYALEELDFIRDVVYEADVKYQTKLDKNDVARIALQWLMTDYRANKQESLLVSILARKKARK